MVGDPQARPTEAAGQHAVAAALDKSPEATPSISHNTHTKSHDTYNHHPDLLDAKADASTETLTQLTPRTHASQHSTAPLAEGSVGAGTGASVGKLLGPEHTMKGGLGARAFAVGKLQVGAVTAVNACGNVVDPTTLEPIAGMRDETGRILDMEAAMIEQAAHLSMPLDQGRANTTISCIITNARLTKAQATKVAQMAADAYARTIRPAHTTNDGDSIFVLASGEMSIADTPPIDLIGVVAVQALEAAIVAAIREATSLCGVPAARELGTKQA
ncbi:P1 family peptidase [Collinsella sp. AGMB00827]|uniref:P1 family peptidase n=2 Tax=Collinsella ureilytica TaxID=2869515 RepID=A0ABS7MHW9_9ACTN|nr:P1 family peptidase [Collinsella urealyticum]